MSTLQESLEDSLNSLLSHEDWEDRRDELLDALDGIIPDLADSLADSTLKAIKKDARSGLKANRKTRQRFEKNHWKHWQKPLELLELFVALATEAGENSIKALPEDISDDAAVFAALTPLHARACQVASAILALLRAGYADDAHARWRALHEIAVVSQFINEQGRDTAERYLLHDAIQRYKLALKLQKHAGTINAEPLSQGEFDEIKAERDALLARFGKSFGEDYGWAAAALRDKRPTIAKIEASVDLNHWRPYYGMASDNVHANAHGTYFRLGLDEDDPSPPMLLAGASSMGLVAVGHPTAISLCQVTTALLTIEPRLDDLVSVYILMKLLDEIGEAFVQA